MASTELQQKRAVPIPKLMAAPAAPGVAPTPAIDMPPAEPTYGTIIPNRIFVGGISRDTTETDLMVAFSTYGVVKSTKIIVDQDGYNKGYGFVTFETQEEAQRLQTVGNCVVLRNRRLNIAPAFKKQPVRPKLQPIIDSNGTVYFASQPQSTVNSVPIAQMSTARYPQAASVTDFTASSVPALYQQTSTAVQYQPIYQYYSVPISVPTVWPHNYYQEPRSSNSQSSLAQQSTWEHDGANQSTWRST